MDERQRRAQRLRYASDIGKKALNKEIPTVKLNRVFDEEKGKAVLKPELSAGAAGCAAFRPRTEQHRKAGLREGYAVAAFGWLAASALGALPFFFAAKMQWYDALFESVSGFTTTGAALIHRGYELTDGSVLPDGVESLSRGVVFWRALESWLGGMGIVVLALAVLPMFNRGGQMLYNAETPGLKSSDTQIAPRITSSAKILWLIYVGITACEVVFLHFAGMGLFEAVCNSFTTISTYHHYNTTDSNLH